MANKKLQTTAAYWLERQKGYPLPEWPAPLRRFTDKELKAKSKRWLAQIQRATPGRFDTIPSERSAVERLVGALFYPADAAILLANIYPKEVR